MCEGLEENAFLGNSLLYHFPLFLISRLMGHLSFEKKKNIWVLILLKFGEKSEVKKDTQFVRA